MQYTADVVHPKGKSAGAVQWAHSSLSRIPESRVPNPDCPESRLVGFGGENSHLFLQKSCGERLRGGFCGSEVACFDGDRGKVRDTSGWHGFSYGALERT